MTVTADKKGRITCYELFPPGSRFDAERDETGRVILTKLVKDDGKAELVKPVLRDGLLVIPGEIDQEALDKQIRDQRDRDNARLLG